MTFADKGESTDPVTVTVSGAKTVNQLAFTADNRNVTLSGDAITAGTVLKGGDGIVTINSALSVSTALTVNGGVLVLNPTDEVVSDVWTASDEGTLVVYVGSGETTTMSATITAAKLVKRGGGVLMLSSANTIGATSIEGGTIKIGNGACIGSGDIRVSSGGALDVNATYLTNQNQIYIAGNGPDNGGALVNSGSNMGGGSKYWKVELTDDASWGGTGYIHFDSTSVITLNGHTFTKKGTNNFPMRNTTITGPGTIVVAAGTFTHNAGSNILDNVNLEISSTGVLDLKGEAATDVLSVEDFSFAGTINATGTNGKNAALKVNGMLNVNGSQSIPKLELASGSTVKFATAASALTASSAFTFGSGTVTVAFANGVTPTAGVLIDWSGASLQTPPPGNFILNGDFANTHVLTKSATGLSIAKGAASVTTTSGTTPYTTVVAAVQAAAQAGGALEYITILTDGEVSIPMYAYEMNIKNEGGATITISGVSEEYSVDSSTTSGITTYTISPAATEYTWTGTDSYETSQGDTRNWSTEGNWTYGSGKAASRAPTSGDSVVFNDGATVTLDAGVIVAGVEVNGAVSISGTAKELKTTGDITGTGTLTLSDICLSGDGAGITVAPNIHFTNDSEFAGDNTLTITGDVEISGYFKVWGVGANHIIAGTAQINAGANFSSGNTWLIMNGAATVKGAFTTGGTKLKFSKALTIEAGGVTVNGSNVNLDSDTATIVLAGAGATLTDSRGDPIANNKVSTTVADSYVKKTGSTFAVAAKTVVTVSVGSNVSLTINGSAVADGDTLKFAPGDTFTYVATPAANYTANVTVTGGTDNDGTVTVGETAITVAATATHDAVSVSNIAFEYLNDYATAIVTATVSDPTATYKMTVGVNEYTGVVSGTTVTFSNVVTGHSSAYDSVSYEITATDGTSSVVVSGGSGAAPVADVTADWINENATTHGQASAGGSWTNAAAVTYSEGKAAISDNRFVAAEASTASHVVLKFEVCFSSTSEEDVSGEAQAAIKLGEEDSVTTFKVLAPANTWTPVSCAGFTPDASATYKVVLAIDYGNNTYGVTVGNYVMTNSAGVASFPLAANRTSVQTIDFAGSGTLTSMKGDQVEGYMVVDKNGTRYASISAAITAYLEDPTIAPLKVLHNGTAPSGWKIVTEGGVDILKKVAKGLFFMAY